ncbi:hypothetical protein ABFG93_16390 [Pseudalkalibacillus hwajinpoensis]|uniref:hypothetical protein n=1 Tax=Guptibacillus hwajinpoensis TaxID=208199 RepID=UPI00325C12E0
MYDELQNNQEVQRANPQSQAAIMQLCRKYMNFHVHGQMRDGSTVEGILTDMDHDSMTMLIPEEVDETELNSQTRQYGGFGRRRFRRFRRRRFPFSPFIFIAPYPYYYPPYPYSPYQYPYY